MAFDSMRLQTLLALFTRFLSQCSRYSAAELSLIVSNIATNSISKSDPLKVVLSRCITAFDPQQAPIKLSQD
jgi:hypothetical protein